LTHTGFYIPQITHLNFAFYAIPFTPYFVVYAQKSSSTHGTGCHLGSVGFLSVTPEGYSQCTAIVTGAPSFCTGGTTTLQTPSLPNANYCWRNQATASTWQNVGAAGFSAGAATYPSLVFDGRTPYVAYADGTNGYKATVMKFNGTSWVSVGTAGFTAGLPNYIRFAFGGSTPYVAYKDFSAGSKTTVMKFNGASWVNVGTTGFSAGVASFLSLAFGGSTPYVAYQDATNSSKTTVMKFDSTSWVNVGTIGFSAGGAGFQSLAFCGGTLYVAYQDVANSSKTTVMKFDIPCLSSSNALTVSTAGTYTLTITNQSGRVATSAPVVVSENPGSVAGNTTVVAGVNSTNLALSGQTGSVVKWQSYLSTDFSSPVDVADTTTNLTATALTQTTYFRAVVQSAVCTPAFSTSATITVTPASVGGSVAGSTTVCAGTNSTNLTLSGQTGSVVRCQSSLNAGFSSPTNISNTTTGLTPGNLTQTTYYRAVVQSGADAPTFSTTATVTVDPASVGGSVAGSTTVIAGGNSTNLTLSGQTGSVVKWQSSLTAGFSSPTDIVNTTANLTATTLTQTTYFRAVVQSGVCAPAFSASASITVTPASAGGSVAGSTMVCAGTNSTNLTLNGQTGSVVRWQSSLNAGFYSPTDISNTTTSLTATNLTQTTYYRAVVQSGADAPTFSTTATVTVDPASVGGSVAGSTTVVAGGNNTNLALSGQTGSVVKWQYSLNIDFSSPVDIVNTTANLAATNLTQTTYFQAVVQSGVCAPAFSASATITVTPVSAGGSVAGSATVCAGTNSTNLTLSGQTGSVIKWQSSLNTGFFSPIDISNTTTSLTATNLAQTTYFRAVVQSGADAPTFSTTATLTVTPTPTAPILSPSPAATTVGQPITVTASGCAGTVV
jgi:hypothetical protein